MITTELAPGILEHKLWEPLVTSSAEYQHVHELVRKTYGLATKYLCENCDNQAYEYAWNHEYDPRIVTSYDPMCYSCHREYDDLGFHIGHTTSQGEKHWFAKLFEEDVLEIRRMWATGVWTHQEISEFYPVGRATITLIISRKIWKHI